MSTKKKKYIVVPRNEKTQAAGLQTGKGTVKFGKKTAAWVDDPALAREINTHHGLRGSGDVWVEQDENLEWHAAQDGDTDGRNRSKGGHRYFFGYNQSKAWTDFWDRYEKKKEKK